MKKTKGITDSVFLALLQKVLPKATKDTRLATTIYEEVAKEVRLINSLESFEKFCDKETLPDLEAPTLAEFQSQLVGKFGPENVHIEPNEEGTALEVAIALPDREVKRLVNIAPPGAAADEDEVKHPFVPFPVCLPDDPELIWALGRRENFSAEEAARSLSAIEEEFWSTKAGQKLQRDGVERSFAEFIAQVPAAALTESGLRRHYKEPETLSAVRLLAARSAESIEKELANT